MQQCFSPQAKFSTTKLKFSTRHSKLFISSLKIFTSKIKYLTTKLKLFTTNMKLLTTKMKFLTTVMKLLTTIQSFTIQFLFSKLQGHNIFAQTNKSSKLFSVKIPNLFFPTFPKNPCIKVSLQDFPVVSLPLLFQN